MEEFPGKRTNSRIYVFSGYTYHKDKRCEYIYRCTKRRNFKCRGRLQQEGEIYTLMAEHDHPPKATSSEILKMKKEMKEMCKQRDISSKEIFDRVSRRYPTAATSLTYSTMRTILYREKMKFRPPLPSNFLNLQTQLQSYENLKDIYKDTATATSGEIAFIFSTNELLKQLGSSKEMFLDGTFSVSIYTYICVRVRVRELLKYIRVQVFVTYALLCRVALSVYWQGRVFFWTRSLKSDGKFGG